jgi:AcrR family transcriptional regulator
MKMKERILFASQELFLKYGIRSISMDDIAKHLAISKKTIYEFFKDKDELVQVIMLKELNKNRCDFKKIGKASANVIEEFFEMMQHASEMFGKINPSVFYDLQKYHPEAWNLFQEFKRNYILKIVEGLLKKGIKQGYIRPDIRPEILARMRIAQIDMGFNPDIFPSGKFTVTEVQMAMLEHFLYGICTLRGYKLINKYKRITEDE